MNARQLVKKVMPTGLFRLVEPASHLLEAVFWNLVYGFPARDLKVIGVTGTNGKTTTCFLIHTMLSQAGFKVGLMSTVAFGVGEQIEERVHHMTTDPARVLLKQIKQMRAQNIDYLILETTSHALAQHRVFGVPYSIAVFTNLTPEHITYHGTFERYREAKVRLFKLADRNRNGQRLGIVNADDPNYTYFADAIKNVVTYGVDNGEARAEKIKLGADGISLDAKMGGEIYHLKCQIPGSFNVYNTLAAACVGRALGLSRQQVEQGIAGLKGVEGRMTKIDEGQDFDVIVDYAHTPDSFERLFSGLNLTGKLIVLFGSLGGGDKGKRPAQGQIAGKYADTVVITEEDDRTELPEDIMNDIAAGAEKSGKIRDTDLFLIHDRVEAMEFALKKAQKGDTVLFLGKGHEKTMEDAAGEHPWDEIATARKLLKS